MAAGTRGAECAAAPPDSTRILNDLSEKLREKKTSPSLDKVETNLEKG